MKAIIPLFLLLALPIALMTPVSGQPDAKVAGLAKVKKPALTFYYYDQ